MFKLTHLTEWNLLDKVRQCTEYRAFVILTFCCLATRRVDVCL